MTSSYEFFVQDMRAELQGGSVVLDALTVT